MAVDRISELPDEILCHILSFLPTKLAFTTTVLSKRWTPLFYSLAVLRFRFNNETLKNHNSFDHLCRFIDTLMLSPRVSNQPIKKFSLKCRFLCRKFNSPSKSNVSAWVEAAAPKLRHVEKFVLILHHSITLKLNPSSLTSGTLVILKLEDVQIQSNNNLCADLPSLKTLHFRSVRFKNKNDFMKLLNACPLLQDLHASYIKYDENNEEAKEFKSLSLSKLVRANICSKDIPFTAIYNVDFLCIFVRSGVTFKSIPVFQNLIHIELWFYNFSCGWDGIVELLLNCPKLQILFIRKGIELSLSKDLECPISAIECLSSHLRLCTIVNLNGSDIPFATYILQNARLLEVMKINVSASSSEGMQKHEIIEKLSTCPRMSPGCKLSF